MYKVYKFGGASIKDANAIRNISKIISKNNKKTLIIVSAIGKTTNKLEEILFNKFKKLEYSKELESLKQDHLNISKNLFSENHSIFSRLENIFGEIDKVLNKKFSNYDFAYDSFISFGELLSSTIVYYYLKEIKENSKWIDARSYIKTDDNFRSANVKWELSEELIQLKLPEILEENVLISQGFIASNIKKQNTTLGREGSDFSAAIFAYCLKAKSLTIWKDVPGIMNADPKRFPNCQLLENISYQDASEMTFYGASVIHPKTIRPLAKRGIALHVRPFLEPENEGSVISKESDNKNTPCFMVKENQVLVSLKSKTLNLINSEDLSLIFSKISESKIKINLTQNSAISFSFCCDWEENQVSKLINSLKSKFDIQFNKNLQLLTIKDFQEANIKDSIKGKSVLLEQKSRKTFQALVEVKD